MQMCITMIDASVGYCECSKIIELLLFGLGFPLGVTWLIEGASKFTLGWTLRSLAVLAIDRWVMRLLSGGLNCCVYRQIKSLQRDCVGLGVFFLLIWGGVIEIVVFFFSSLCIQMFSTDPPIFVIRDLN